MFADAVSKVSGALRPMHIIRRRFGDDAILPDISTLFFVNEFGCAITSKRTANILTAANATDQQYRAYLERKAQLSHDESYRFTLKRLESDMKLNKDSIIQIRFAFMGCAKGNVRVTCVPHPKYDLALLRFSAENGFLYQDHVTFAESAPKQGQSVCRLGFALPEFTNFRMNKEQNAIEFCEGKNVSSVLALDGMVTRYLSDGERAFGIETTNAGPVGMNGGPLFDTEGHVVGLQSGIGLMMLGADIKMNLPNSTEPYVDHGSLHLAVHTHLDVIKDFLRAQNVMYYEA